MLDGDYADYLNSPRWRALRLQAKEDAGHRCRLCNSPKRLNVHHRTYKTIGTEFEIEDLTVLCRDCHAAYHERQGHKQKHPSPRKRQERKAKALHREWFKRFI